MTLLLIFIYSYLLLVSLTNLLLMRRPKSRLSSKTKVAVLIPARNEEDNLKTLLPNLAKEVDQIFVYDDDSDDKTAEVAKEFGATVVTGKTLPVGWTGKNHACDRLALVASEASSADWWIYLDADTRVNPGFGNAVRNLADTVGKRTPCITGFGKFIPGSGIEPAYLFWVPYVLLATIPFGLINRSRATTPPFTNGQFTMWNPSRYMDIRPHQARKSAILEDVKIGRMLARQKIPIEVVLLPKVFEVQMYKTLPDAVRGMAKNSFQITGSLPGSILFGMLLGFIALAGIATPFTLPILILSGLFVALSVRSFYWAFLFLPISLIAAGFTILRSSLSPHTTQIWKGRNYAVINTPDSVPDQIQKVETESEDALSPKG